MTNKKVSDGHMEKLLELSSSDSHCPCCGKKGGVYYEIGDGDYYHGPEMFCLDCKSSFAIHFYNRGNIKVEELDK